jgi:hypothetical protein
MAPCCSREQARRSRPTVCKARVHARSSRSAIGPAGHLAFVAGLHAALDVTVMGSRYWLTHAGVPRLADYPDAPRHDFVRWLAEHVPDELVWGWNAPPPLEMPVLDRPVVMGHVTVPDPIDAPGLIAINTGAGDDNGRLTAVILPDRKFVTVG